MKVSSIESGKSKTMFSKLSGTRGIADYLVDPDRAAYLPDRVHERTLPELDLATRRLSIGLTGA
jgi:hypothetical protein